MSDELTGPNQAKAMLHRVSPEGRARAMREQRRRRQRSLRLLGRVLILAVAVAAALGGYALAAGSLPPIAVALAFIVIAIGAFAIAARVRGGPPDAPALGRAPLDALPQASAQWLEARCPQLPAPAVPIADGLAAEIAAFGPQLARLPADAPAAEAVRRLLAVELPALVERHQSIPESLRGRAREGGRSADAHLVEGLTIVREEVARMSEQLAGGEFDALATQNRFLELKYQGEAMLALPSPGEDPPA